MSVISDFSAKTGNLVSILSRMSDRDLLNEYIILQGAFNAFDSISDSLDCSDSLLLPYLDFLEKYMVSEICRRFCEQYTTFQIPTYEGYIEKKGVAK